MCFSLFHGKLSRAVKTIVKNTSIPYSGQFNGFYVTMRIFLEHLNTILFWPTRAEIVVEIEKSRELAERPDFRNAYFRPKIVFVLCERINLENMLVFVDDLQV